jgi:tetratricopeptide (TPR) repeat protein
MPESLARTLPLAVPTHPGRLHYELDLEWPEGLAALDGPMRERLQTPHFELAVEREAHERRLRLRLTLQPLQRAVPAAELTQLARDLRRLDGWLQGHCSACDRSATPGLQARLAAHWHRQVDRLSHTLAHQPLPAHERASALCLRAQAWMELGAAQAALRDANEAITLAAHPAAWTARGKAHWALGRLDEAEADFERSLQVERF